ncbi:MAG: glutamate 5-kinase [Alphaproteobacteria bacterium]
MSAPATSQSADAASLSSARRLIVKIGSALLIGDTGQLRHDWLAALCADIAALKQSGAEIIVVSSGAVAVGRGVLRLGTRVLKLEEKQAAAAAGQIRLAHAWQEALAAHDIGVAQILLTPGDTEERRRHLNARSTIETLLALGVVPIINENDSVATDELRFGDNDRLAARVAQMTSADTMVLLSDIDGLYTADPKHDAAAVFVPKVTEITPAIEAMAGQAAPGHASGGMVTKIAAANIAMRAGCRMVIADGKKPHSLAAVGIDGRCTWFVPGATPATARKRWIAGALTLSGAITVDDGAVAALGRGKSLLPAGVVAVEGSFERGDAVIVRDSGGRRLGCGLSAYSASDARLILGHKTREIEGLLGYRGRDEMIHRDDLVLDL